MTENFNMYHDLGELGQAKAYSEAGTAAATGTSIMAAVLPTVAAIPIAGAVVAGVVSLLALFHVGEGCGQACITSAETEQIFECASEDVLYAAKAGQITAAQAQAAMQWLLIQGQQQMASLQSSDPKAKGGLTNLTNSIQGEIASIAPNTPPIPTDAPTAALNPTQLEGSIFVQPGAAGWYASSVSQGASLALQAIADVTGVTAGASSSAAQGPAPASGIVAQAQAVVSSLTSTDLLLGLGLLAGLGFLLLRRGNERKGNN